MAQIADRIDEHNGEDESEIDEEEQGKTVRAQIAALLRARPRRACFHAQRPSRQHFNGARSEGSARGCAGATERKQQECAAARGNRERSQRIILLAPQPPQPGNVHMLESLANAKDEDAHQQHAHQ